MTRSLAALVAVVVVGSVAVGQTVTWTGPGTGGSWASAANWSSNPALPGPANTALFGSNITGTAAVTLDGNQSVGAIHVGPGAVGAVTVSAGSVSTSVLTLVGNGGFARAEGNDLIFTAPVSVTAANFSLVADAGRTLSFAELRGTVASPGVSVWQVASTGTVQIGAGGYAVSSAGPNGGQTISVQSGSTLQLTASQDWQQTNTGITVNGGGTVNLGGAGQTVTVRPSGTAGQPVPGVLFNTLLTGGAGLTLTPVGGTAPGAGLLQLVATGASNDVPNTANGPLTVNGGTFGVAGNSGAAWGGTSVSVTAGQMLPGNAAQPAAVFNNPLPAATTLSLTGSGSYNLGAPDLGTGSMAAATPLRHAQTFASVTHASTGAFHTGASIGAAGVTVAGTLTHSGVGTLTVSPSGILNVVQLDLPSGGGAVTVQATSSGGPTQLVVRTGGLSMASRTITLAGQAGVGASVSLLTGAVVTSTGTSSVVGTGPAGTNAVVMGSSAQAFNVTSGTLTITAGLSGGGVAKQGAGTLVLGGNYLTTTNTVRLEAGRLVLASPGAVGTSNTLVLAAGTVSTADPTTGVGVSNATNVPSFLRFDTLTGSAATLELGTGAHVFRFTNFGTISGGPFALTITGWQGPDGGSGTAGQIVFTNPGPLGSYLSQVSFQGYSPGATLIAYPGGGFELVPVPEPTAVLAVAIAGLAAFRVVRRRIVAGRTAVPDDGVGDCSPHGTTNA